MRYTVYVMPRALRQLTAIASWWQVNRQEAPDLAEHEILAAAASLDIHPGRGRIVARHEHRRMLVTPRTRFLIVYRIRARAKRVEIVEIRRP